MSGPLAISAERDGALVHLTLARPKANIVDAAMIAALSDAFSAIERDRAVKAVLLSAEGPHFSFGASVEEHMPDQCADMLKSLHSLILSMLSSPAPILVAVQGQCLGGGLEVAMAGNLIFAAPDARLGQPEIGLAVIAPAASCLLPELVGPQRADDLLFSGRSIGAEEARSMGLVLEIADDPKAAAMVYFDKHLASKSAAALRGAKRASRADFTKRVRTRISEVEALYLKEVMSTHDAIEGLNAFLEKRPALWENR